MSLGRRIGKNTKGVTLARSRVEFNAGKWGDTRLTGYAPLDVPPQPITVTPLPSPVTDEGTAGIPSLITPYSNMELTNAVRSLMYFVGGTDATALGADDLMNFVSGYETVDFNPPAPLEDVTDRLLTKGTNYFRSGWESLSTRLNNTTAVEWVSVAQLSDTRLQILNTSGNVNLTMPAHVEGLTITIKRIGNVPHVATIIDEIDGVANETIEVGEALTLVSVNSKWYII